MKKLAITFALLGFLSSPMAKAGKEIDRILDSYVIAKAETNQMPYSDAEMKMTPYTIQVASYLNEKDAVTHVEELKLQEKDVVYFPSFVHGQVWFKVCVGKFVSREGAEMYRTKFVKRVDEPFAVTISLLGETESDKRKPASVATTEKSGKAFSLKLKKAPESSPKVFVPIKPENKPETKSEETYYSLQIGAYPNEALVKEKLAKLTLGETDVFYKSANVNGKEWYRLFVGKFKSHKDAEAYKEQMKEKMQGAESFIRKITK